MSKKFIILEEEKELIRKMYLSEEKPEGDRKFCHSGNVKSLEEIVGDESLGFELASFWVSGGTISLIGTSFIFFRQSFKASF